jgi:hypothetical protein
MIIQYRFEQIIRQAYDHEVIVTDAKSECGIVSLRLFELMHTVMACGNKHKGTRNGGGLYKGRHCGMTNVFLSSKSFDALSAQYLGSHVTEIDNDTYHLTISVYNEPHNVKNENMHDITIKVHRLDGLGEGGMWVRFYNDKLKAHLPGSHNELVIGMTLDNNGQIANNGMAVILGAI